MHLEEYHLLTPIYSRLDSDHAKCSNRAAHSDSDSDSDLTCSWCFVVTRVGSAVTDEVE